MADIRINSLPTTASASSSDDFLALDGATNGTRKLNAYSPTFGGNLTVSGGTARFQDPTNSYGVTITTTAAKTLVETLFGGSSLGIRVGGSGSDSLTIASTGATIRDNLTVSGTGGISIGSATFTGGRALTATTGTGNSVAIRLLQTVVADWEIKNEATTGALSFAQSTTDYARLTATGNFLLGTTTDVGPRLLSKAKDNTYAGAGIGIVDQSAGTSYITRANGTFYISNNGSTDHFALDASGNATFAGTVTAKKLVGTGVNDTTSAADIQLTGRARLVVGLTGTSANYYDANTHYFRQGDGAAAALTLSASTATFAGAIAIGNTVQTAAAVASTHKVTVVIGGVTYYLLATNV